MGRVRNPGSGKAPVNTPARGAGSGQWGGPAKGAGRGGPARPRTAADSRQSAAIHAAIAADPEWRMERKRREMAKEERIADLIEVMEGVALDPKEYGSARVMAADKALDRLAGKVPQTNTNLNVSVFDKLTTDQQRTVVEALDALAADAGESEAGASETHH